MRLRHILLIVLLLVLAAPAGAAGLLDKNVHYFQPVIDGSGVVWTVGSEPLTMFRMHYGAWLDDAVDSVDYLEDDNNRLYRIVENQVSANLVYAVGFFHFLNVGFDLSFTVFRQLNEDFEEKYDFTSFAVEDIRFEVKGTILNRRQKCVGLALLGRVTTPLAYQENSFVSDKTTTLAPVLVADLGRRRWTVAANLGYKYYVTPQGSELFALEVGDELTLNLGGVLRVDRSNQVLADLATRTQVRAPYGEPDLDYMEVLVAYRKYWQRLNFTALTAGVGMGLLSGVGDPKIRFFVGVTRDERRLGPGDVYF